MQLNVIKSFSEYNMLTAEGKFNRGGSLLVPIMQSEYTRIMGNASTGRMLYLKFEGSAGELSETIALMRPKKGERMLLRISAAKSTPLTAIDYVSQMFRGFAYEATTGIALFTDIFPDEFIVEGFIKYEPQNELRLSNK